jgi:hypothetical protein
MFVRNFTPIWLPRRPRLAAQPKRRRREAWPRDAGKPCMRPGRKDHLMDSSLVFETKQFFN